MEHNIITKHNSKLKPCPFCGQIPVMYQTETCPHYEIRCKCRMAQTDEYHTVDEVIEVWNTRVE